MEVRSLVMGERRSSSFCACLLLAALSPVIIVMPKWSMRDERFSPSLSTMLLTTPPVVTAVASVNRFANF